MTVVHYESPTPLPPSRPGDELQPGPIGWVARLRGAAEYAAHIAQTDFVPQALRGNPPRSPPPSSTAPRSASNRCSRSRRSPSSKAARR
jgi:hypothetical protein